MNEFGSESPTEANAQDEEVGDEIRRILKSSEIQDLTFVRDVFVELLDDKNEAADDKIIQRVRELLGYAA